MVSISTPGQGRTEPGGARAFPAWRCKLREARRDAVPTRPRHARGQPPPSARAPPRAGTHAEAPPRPAPARSLSAHTPPLRTRSPQPQRDCLTPAGLFTPESEGDAGSRPEIRGARAERWRRPRHSSIAAPQQGSPTTAGCRRSPARYNASLALPGAVPQAAGCPGVRREAGEASGCAGGGGAPRCQVRR